MHSDSHQFSGRKNEVCQKIMETCSKILFLFVSMSVWGGGRGEGGGGEGHMPTELQAEMSP